MVNVKKPKEISDNEYTPPVKSDDNPCSEVCPIPNDELEGCRYPYKKISMVGFIAKGEAANAPDVIVQTANGTQNSFGKDKGRQYNWGNGDAGEWNNNNFEGGNLTGM